MISKRRYVSNQHRFGCNAPQSETVHSSVGPVVCQHIPHCWAGASSQRDGWGILARSRTLSLSLSFFLFSLSSHFFQIGHFSFPNFPSWKNLLDASSYCVHRPIPVLFFPLISGKKYRQTSFLDLLMCYTAGLVPVSGAYWHYLWFWAEVVCLPHKRFKSGASSS